MFRYLQPVYLKAGLLQNSGIINCCLHAPFEYLPVTCPCCRSFASVTINVTDMCDYLVTRKSFSDIPVDSKLLHEPITKEMLSHEPYTPESADSHSPNTEKIDIEQTENRKDSVSPLQLRNRLENIIQTSQSPETFIKRCVSQNAIVASVKEDFHKRTLSETVRKTTRARLISSASANSTVRLQSHHSSSDEDWFEFDENLNSRNSKEDCLLKEDAIVGSVFEICDSGAVQDAKSNVSNRKSSCSAQECCCCVM